MNQADNESQLKNIFDSLLASEWDVIDFLTPHEICRAIDDSVSIIEFLSSTINQTQAAQRLLDNLNLVRRGIKSKHFFQYVVYPDLEHFFYLLKNDAKHGGVRQGAGRKKSAPTKQVRVPEDLAHVVAALVEVYKSGRWDSDYRTRVSRYINETDMATLVDDSKIERDWLSVKNRKRE
ncbi:hypothetical protein [Vibrio lentus]|uniref:hypothetical protein n=1 Tax=Vibrio lentus TaxID=136468 RepID=UPI000C82BD45|nr:hypothetical protein [Vibrio lentus]PMI15256.1 hypothetical protein BCU51_18345 [Vibrio lentus]PMK36318.1 hypothetical protein BCU02_01355 [Vibrio lentus]